MTIRLLLVTPNADFVTLMTRVLDTALELTGLDAVLNSVSDVAGLQARVDQQVDDVILLDWDVAQADTPQLVRHVLTEDPRLRLVAMLPLSNRQYRQKVWAAGACNGIPKEHVDQEWMATVLCIMQRAMEREARLLQTFS